MWILIAVSPVDTILFVSLLILDSTTCSFICNPVTANVLRSLLFVMYCESKFACSLFPYKYRILLIADAENHVCVLESPMPNSGGSRIFLRGGGHQLPRVC